VHVDVDRVEARLREAGLQAAGGGGGQFRLELLEVPSERAWAAVRRALQRDGGVERVVPIELSPGRALLSVEAPAGSKAAVDRLLAADLGPGISLQALSRAGDTVRLRVFDMGPPAEEEEPEPAVPGTP
jgi:hypothetical protein